MSTKNIILSFYKKEKWLEACADCNAYLSPEYPKTGRYCSRCFNVREKKIEYENAIAN